MTTAVDNRASFKPASGEVPAAPGVYRFSDKRGRPLYIGKAKNLRNRLANYFQPYDKLAPRTTQMLRRAAHLDWTLVASETESLVLEQQWIRQEMPPYNVLFRDDKTFPYLAVTLGSEAPMLKITRNMRIKGAKYFGPYPKTWALRETVQLLNQAFAVRTCSDADYNRAMRTGKPCFAGQIGKCRGPCSMLVSVEQHNAAVASLLKFLKNLDSKKAHDLEREMRLAAAAQDYELAASLRDQLQAVEAMLESNNIVLGLEVNADFFGLYSDDLTAAVHQFIVRGGRIRGERSWLVDIEMETEPGQLLQQAVQDAYAQQSLPPGEIYVSKALPDSEQLAALLSRSRPRGGAVLIQTPQRGEKSKLMQTAVRNAGEHLMRYKLKRTNDLPSRTESLAQLQQALGMADPPLRIEGIDVSHLQGTNVVASLVVFEDALPKKSAYRKYKIAETTDDTDSIYQVVSRRAAALNRPDAPPRERPGLLLIDGAAAQVNAAVRALHEQGISDIAVCGIAKRLEELWIPGDEFPIILPRGSETLFLLQRIRDEAHRFAITFQRSKRAAEVKSALSELQGVGAGRAAILLQHFGSAARVRQASVAELAEVAGIGEVLAANIYRQLRD